jgi:Do/DeqQ family serine protease
MSISHTHRSRRIRLGLVGLALTLAVGVGTWHAVLATDDPAAVSAPATGPAVASQLPGVTPDSYADLVQVVAPAVVTIRTEGRATTSTTGVPTDPFGLFGDPFGRQPRVPRTQRGLGSGVIVSEDGYILTNHHVVGSADRITVELSGNRTRTATLVGSDEPSDLALLKVEADDLHPIRLGDSDAVRVGDVVLAIGNPLGIGQTVTMGIVSAKGRSTGPGDGSYEDFLQTDAPINQGNSGGALVNMQGELVGINTQIVSQSGGNIGIGFAIPARMAEHVMTAIRTDGRVHRGQLGVTVQPVTTDLAASLGLEQVDGALVSDIRPGSGADRAGLERADVILEFNGQPVHDTNALRNRVAETAPGSRATLLVSRDGRQRELSVTLDEASAPARVDAQLAAGDASATLGVAVEPLTPALASRMNLGPDVRGLVVGEVRPDSRAASAGIRTGDVIEEVNRQPVTSVDELRDAIRNAPDRPMLVLVHRGGTDLFLTVDAAS